jgi:hypothetical protein
MASRFRERARRHNASGEKDTDVKPSIKHKSLYLTSGKHTQAGPDAKKQRSGIKEKIVVDLVEDEVEIIAVVDLRGGDAVEEDDEI